MLNNIRNKIIIGEIFLNKIIVKNLFKLLILKFIECTKNPSKEKKKKKIIEIRKWILIGSKNKINIKKNCKNNFIMIKLLMKHKDKIK